MSVTVGSILSKVTQVAVISKRTARWERKLQKWHGEGESVVWCNIHPQLLLGMNMRDIDFLIMGRFTQHQAC